MFLVGINKEVIILIFFIIRRVIELKVNVSLIVSVCLVSIHFGLLSGCARFEATGVRRVDHRPIRIGVIEENFVSYFPITVKHFPSNENHKLIIHLKKRIKRKIQYHKESHEETIYQLEGDAFDRQAHTIKQNYEAHPIAGIMELIISPLKILLFYNSKPYRETRYEKNPGSEKVITEYRYDTKNVPAYNATISLEKYGVSKTNENGEMKFIVNPSLFDTGLK